MIPVKIVISPLKSLKYFIPNNLSSHQHRRHKVESLLAREELCWWGQLCWKTERPEGKLILKCVNSEIKISFVSKNIY